MIKRKFNILVITPIKHIDGLYKKISSIGKITYLENPTRNEISKIIKNYEVIFTNPNKSKIFIDSEIIDKAILLKIICTASTGTNHIDVKYAHYKKINIISITNERKLINKISSTAELAFALTLSAIRNINSACMSVLNGKWDYEEFIGDQLNYLNVGVIGYGRLGSMYAKFCLAFGAKVFIYDPYKKVKTKKLIQIDSLEKICSISDIIAIHVHVNDETFNLISKKQFNLMKSTVVLVNTSRGDIINEKDAVYFLKKNNKAKIATDVLADEIRSRPKSPLLKYSKQSNQVLITPHIGGMTKQAQFLAYHRAADLLNDELIKIKNV